MQQQGCPRVFANIHNSRFQCSQGLLRVFASICNASARICLFIYKYSQHKFSICARFSLRIRNICDVINLFSFIIRKYSQHKFSIFARFSLQIRNFRDANNWFASIIRKYSEQVFNIRKIFFQYSQGFLLIILRQFFIIDTKN